MEKTAATWVEFRWLFLLAPVWLIALFSVAYHFLYRDPDVSFPNRIQITRDLETELKNFDLPPETGRNKFETMGKPDSSILVTQVYRTELGDQEFLNFVGSRLEQRGWLPYTRVNQTKGTFNFCRGKYDAELFREGRRGIWADGGIYWSLSFSLGLRTKPLFGSDNLPEMCQQHR